MADQEIIAATLAAAVPVTDGLFGKDAAAEVLKNYNFILTSIEARPATRRFLPQNPTSK